MPLREVLWFQGFREQPDPCDISERWQVDLDTIERIQLASADFVAETGRVVWIISGYRSREEQASLRRGGRPTAPDDVSTHRSCPATGVDVSLGLGATRVMRAIWGRVVVLNGLRWGGGSPVDDGGIPSDWQHVDRGPRTA